MFASGYIGIVVTQMNVLERQREAAAWSVHGSLIIDPCDYVS